MLTRFVSGPDDALSGEIRAAAAYHSGGRLRAAIAWARDGGAFRLLDALAGNMTNIEVVVGLNERGTTIEALIRLLNAGTSVKAFFKHPRQTFHPKVYIFDGGTPEADETTLIVGSSNVTVGGLVSNVEASLVAEVRGSPVTPSDRELIDSLGSFWDEISSSPYCRLLDSVDEIKKLYEGGYLVSERTIRSRRRQTKRSGAAAPAGLLPTAPPIRVPISGYEAIDIPFDLKPEAAEEPPPEAADPSGSVPLPDRFFVRTLTGNDVEKLHGRTPGTFEPDLGETARDTYPAFWGWPDEYITVTRQLPRQEWKAEARLISSLSSSAGAPVTITLWYREARPGHAAEHRLGLSPIPDVRGVVPPNFDTSSVLIVERAPEEADHVFVVRLLMSSDLGYSDFASHLTEGRPQHRFGYGP